MPPKKDPYRDHHKRELERIKQKSHEHKMERDTIYELWFVRKGSKPSDPQDRRYFPSVRTAGNPNQEIWLQAAIETFQAIHKVSDWKEIADHYEVVSIPMP
jgi:hypothetical protein